MGLPSATKKMILASFRVTTWSWPILAHLPACFPKALHHRCLQEPNFQFHRRITSYITLDSQLSYEFKKPAMEAAAGGYSKDAKDVFDRNPPTVIGAFNDNYDTSLYSIRNCYYYLGFNKKF